jgi:ankyrin repeat protein
MRHVLFLLAAWLPVATLNAQDTSPLPYDTLERQASELIGLWLDGGKLCAVRTAEVIQKQKELADGLAAATPETGPRVLQFAVIANSLPSVRRLNEAGASRVADGSSLLHYASIFADPPMLEYLTSIGFGVEELGGAAGPALIVAMTSKRLDNAAWLIEHGANVNATDKAGAAVLLYACVCGDQAIVDFLLEAGAVPDARTRGVAERRGLRL